MRIGRTYATYLSLKLKTYLYKQDELNKQLFYCSNSKYIDRLNSFFESDNLNYRLKEYKDYHYRIENIK